MIQGIVRVFALLFLCLGIVVFLITLPESNRPEPAKLLIRGLAMAVALIGYLGLRLKRKVQTQ